MNSESIIVKQKSDLFIHFPGSEMIQITNTKEFPYATIGRLEVKFNGISGHGTGTLITDRHVLTAAHNLLNKTWGEVQSATFSPGQNKNDFPFKSYKMKRYFVLNEYISTMPPDPSDDVTDYTKYLYDYAIVELDTPVTFTSDFLKPQFINIPQVVDGWVIGYPGDKTKGTMWGAEGKVQQIENEEPFIFHKISTYKGNSGSAVLLPTPDLSIKIAGVHIAGSKALGSNFAVRLTDEVLENINNWILQ